MDVMSDDAKIEHGSGPYHLINRTTGKFAGPFTTELDCHMARSIALPGWNNATMLDRDTFDAWLRTPFKETP